MRQYESIRLGWCAAYDLIQSSLSNGSLQHGGDIALVAVILFHSLRKLSLDFIACKALHGTQVSVGHILLCWIGDGAAWLQAYKKSVRICTDTRGEICNFVARLSAGLFPRRSNPAYSLLVLSLPAGWHGGRVAQIVADFVYD
jgi:hypothetical protein